MSPKPPKAYNLMLLANDRQRLLIEECRDTFIAALMACGGPTVKRSDFERAMASMQTTLERLETYLDPYGHLRAGAKYD